MITACCIVVYGAELGLVHVLVPLPSALVLCFMMSILIGPAVTLTALMWPTYFRVVPGRLDVLAYGPLGHGPPRMNSIDLRASRVLVDTNRDWIVVEPEGQGPVGLELAGVWNRMEFARSVLEAARCRTPSPPLPEGELVG
jgi:hypothetical protein